MVHNSPSGQRFAYYLYNGYYDKFTIGGHDNTYNIVYRVIHPYKKSYVEFSMLDSPGYVQIGGLTFNTTLKTTTYAITHVSDRSNSYIYLDGSMITVKYTSVIKQSDIIGTGIDPVNLIYSCNCKQYVDTFKDAAYRTNNDWDNKYHSYSMQSTKEKIKYLPSGFTPLYDCWFCDHRIYDDTKELYARV